MKFRIMALIAANWIGLTAVIYADAGSSSFAFLRIGNGSRPAALAEAVTASPGDITSAFYNPALLGGFKGVNQIAFMHNQYFNDVTLDYLAFAGKHDFFTIGGYLALGGVNGFERRDHPDTIASGEFGEDNFVAAASLSYDFGVASAGLNLKYAYEKIDYASASAVMFDAGVETPLTEEATVGAAIKNIGSKPRFGGQNYPLSREFRAGFSYRPLYLQQRVTFLADGVAYNDLDSKLNFGAEYNYEQYFALRAGYGTGYDSRRISLGGGIFYRNFVFDYAFVAYKNDIGNAHRFTVIATF